MPRLRITEPEPGSTHDLPDNEHAEVAVGTAPYCGVSCPGVSGLAEVHACIVREARGYVITDLKSTRGTLAGGVRILSPTLMKSGVEYRLGELCLVLEEEEVRCEEPEVVQELPRRRPEPLAVQSALPPQVVVHQPALPPQVVVHQQPVLPQQVVVQQPIVVQQPVVVQMLPAAAAAPAKKTPPTSRQRKREMSVLVARLHRKKRYNYILWLFLWFLITLIMVTALVVFVLPSGAKQAVQHFLIEKIEAYDRAGIPGLFFE